MAKKAMKHKAKPRKKGIRKKFYEIKAPLTSVKIDLYGESAEKLDGHIIKLDLTRSLKGKSFELRLKVKAKEDKLEAEPLSLKLIMSYIRRIMRKGVDYVEDSFEMECRDSIVKVKPFLITRKKVSRAVKRMLREGAKKHLEAKLKIRTAEEIFSDIMANKLQKDLSLKLKKIYPLAFCEIRIFEVIGEKKKEKKAEEKEK